MQSSTDKDKEQSPKRRVRTCSFAGDQPAFLRLPDDVIGVVVDFVQTSALSLTCKYLWELLQFRFIRHELSWPLWDGLPDSKFNTRLLRVKSVGSATGSDLVEWAARLEGLLNGDGENDEEREEAKVKLHTLFLDLSKDWQSMAPVANSRNPQSSSSNASANMPGESGAELLGNILQQMWTLTHLALNLSGAPTTTSGTWWTTPLRSAATVLPQNTKLCHLTNFLLDLSHNSSVVDSSVVTLATALESANARSLEKLIVRLNSTKVTERGISVLAPTLPGLPNLHTFSLFLSNSPVDPIGVDTLSEVIPRCRMLKVLSLYLQRVGIKRAQVEKIAGAVADAPVLQALELDLSKNNEVDDRAMEHLEAAVNASSLGQLTVETWGTAVSSTGQQTIQQCNLPEFDFTLCDLI
eukprot:TRINITY_DN60540_c0_g3_i1.p1 TRINITY_DN60540_c0_g3~~TRINITY_DN60540_c0_g3_i1.p1  ORF type:complete len:410 (+),score=39.79 TRINITY_DN60540_c0_g3_i1:122-1351(+)